MPQPAPFLAPALATEGPKGPKGQAWPRWVSRPNGGRRPAQLAKLAGKSPDEWRFQWENRLRIFSPYVWLPEGNATWHVDEFAIKKNDLYTARLVYGWFSVRPFHQILVKFLGGAYFWDWWKKWGFTNPEEVGICSIYSGPSCRTRPIEGPAIKRKCFGAGPNYNRWSMDVFRQADSVPKSEAFALKTSAWLLRRLPPANPKYLPPAISTPL